MMAKVYATPNDLVGQEGTTLGPTDWLRIDQDRRVADVETVYDPTNGITPGTYSFVDVAGGGRKICCHQSRANAAPVQNEIGATARVARTMPQTTPGSLRSHAMPCPRIGIGSTATSSSTEPAFGSRMR